MGYRQHNNPFSKSISPLKHNVTDRSGNPWEHVHDGRNVTGKRQFREIKGQSTFGQKADKKVRGRTEREIAMEYANQLADYYNQGAITGGNFRADDFDRIKNFKRSKKQRGFFGRLTGIDIFRDQHGRVVVDTGKRGKSIGGTNQYNVQQGEWDKDAKAFKNIPEEQVTADQIYEMMVQGGGLVSIVDGKIVAGNPNKDYIMKDYQGEGYDAVPLGYNIVDDQRSDEPKKKTVAELLQERRERNNPISMMKNSPLQSNHGTDQRSDNEQEGYDYVYRPDDAVTTTERVELDDGGYKIITRIVTPGTGTQIIEEPGGSGGDGGSSSGEGFYNPELPNQTWDEWVKAPCPSPGKNRQAGDKYCPPKTDEVEIVNVSEEIFPPTPPPPIEEPDDSGPPPLDLGVKGVSKIRGGDFRFHIPDIDLMGGIRAVIDGVVFTNKGRCKSGCATNKNS
ncbi:MAG: hypothetical protein HRT87_08310 [Legionellales bacterium]|nr:hypothetical protein [Legionellales bacterium]